MVTLLSAKAIAHFVYGAIADDLRFSANEKEETVIVSRNDVDAKVNIRHIPNGPDCRIIIKVTGALLQGRQPLSYSATAIAQLLSAEGREVVYLDSCGSEGIEVAVMVPAA